MAIVVRNRLQSMRFFAGILLVIMPTLSTRADEADEAEATPPVRISHDEHGIVVLEVEKEIQELIALVVSPVEAATLRPFLTAYGKLELDPAKSFIVRAPAAGIVRASAAQSWPRLGWRMESNTVVGHIEPRFTPLDLADVLARRMDAEAEVAERTADLVAARASFESKNRLNTEGGLVSSRLMEESQARVQSEEARLEAAKRKVGVYASLLSGESETGAPFPLQIAARGQVVEVAAQPDEAVEAGQVLFKVAGFDRLIARVALFAGEGMVEPIPEAQISVAGSEQHVMVGRPIGMDAAVDPVTGGLSLLYSVDLSVDASLRPGLPVVAMVPISGAPLPGVVIPSSAILRHGGRTWVYIKSADNQFERHDVTLAAPTTLGWFATAGVSPQELVVTDGAQMLLSEELKSQIESEAEAEE